MATAKRRAKGSPEENQRNGQPGGTAVGRETAARILSVTKDLLGERGYAGTSLSAICDRADVRPPSIYYLFGSKDGLLRAVLEDVAAGWISAQQALYESARRQQEEPRAMLESRLEVVRRQMQEQPAVFRILYMQALERGHEDSATLATLRRVRSLFISDWECVIRDLLPPSHPWRDSPDSVRALASVVLATADGIFMSTQIEHDAASAERMIRELRHLLTLALQSA